MKRINQFSNGRNMPHFKASSLSMAVISAIAVIGMASPVIAQPSDREIVEIITLGSRQPGRSAQDIPVPVDSLEADALRATGHTEVGRMLQSLAPSFNFSSSSISDGTDDYAQLHCADLVRTRRWYLLMVSVDIRHQ